MARLRLRVQCWSTLVLRVKKKLASYFQFSANVVKFESQESFFTLLLSGQFPTADI